MSVRGIVYFYLKLNAKDVAYQDKIRAPYSKASEQCTKNTLLENGPWERGNSTVVHLLPDAKGLNGVVHQELKHAKHVRERPSD